MCRKVRGPEEDTINWHESRKVMGRIYEGTEERELLEPSIHIQGARRLHSVASLFLPEGVLRNPLVRTLLCCLHPIFQHSYSF